MPSLAEVGGLTTPGGVKPSLPDNPSRIPGKRTASTGWSTASASTTQLNTPGCLIPGTPQLPQTPLLDLVPTSWPQPPLVHIHCQGEYEVEVDVPVLTGRRPEVYRHLRPLQQILGKLLLLILQHGCRGLPSEMRKSDLMNRLPSRWLVPHSMEPETSEPEGSQGFASSFHGLLGCHIQEDGMRHCNWYHVAHLQDSDHYEVGGIQLVCRICTGACSMPHIQMHVGSAEGLRGNVVRLIHEPHSYGQSVLRIEHTFSHGQHQGLLRCCGCRSLHQVGTFWLQEPLQEALQWYNMEHQLLKGLGEA